MPQIHILDEPTINQIAAGEVVERPSAVVKELIENAMDAGATAITAEIKEGGLSFIRITDNGFGIAKEDIPLAFLRHATSKIRTAEDLLSVTSLGFRGEALSSIAAVSQLELITKTPSALNGYRYLIEGGEEKSIEEIGCPGGTTIIIRNLFYNTPARRKFLKSAVTEAGYISDLMERLMVSHPGVSFKYIMNNQVKLQSSGNHNSKDILYHVYGRDISRELLPLEFDSENLKITGYIGKPVITRGNRNHENYFINGRYIKSNIITKAIEEAYKPFMMQHKYPFTSLYFEIDPSLIDVNVHPQKMEIRLKNGEEVYQSTCQAIRNALSGKEMIPRVLLSPQEVEKSKVASIPEPFEENRRKQFGVQQAKQPMINNELQPGLQLNTGIKTTVNTNGLTVKIKDTDNERNNNTVSYDNHNKISSDSKIAETNDYRLNKSDEAMVKNDKEVKTLNNNIVLTQQNIEKSDAGNSGEIKTNVNSLCNMNNENTDKLSPGEKAYSEITVKDEASIDDNKTVINHLNTTSTQLNKVSTEFNTASTQLNKASTELNKASTELNTATTQLNSATTQLNTESAELHTESTQLINTNQNSSVVNSQMDLFEGLDKETPFLSKKAMEEHHIIGQIFSTYWLVEYKKELYIIDQHAAHEKVLYEKILATVKTKTFSSQQLLPPIVLTLSLREQEVIQKYRESLESLGYEIEYFGGNEYSVRAVPADLYGISEKDLLMEFIDGMADEVIGNTTNTTSILERIASLSCKAAVKANHNLSKEEAASLIKELLTLENPYNCPHGRPVIISMSQYELERKFKRII